MRSRYSRSNRYQIVNDMLKGLAYRNRRDEPLVPGEPRMLADELDRFELALGDELDRLLYLAAGGEWMDLALAVAKFREPPAAPAPEEGPPSFAGYPLTWGDEG